MRTKRNLALAGAVIGSALVLTGCGLDLNFNRSQSVEKYDVTDKVTALAVDAGSGDVIVNESDRTGIQVTETLNYRGAQPTDGHEVSGDTLRLAYDCNDCSIDYRVEVPRGLNVRVDTGSGTITLRSLTGPIDVSTGSGDIEANGLTSKTALADTGSGDVELRFNAAPDNTQVTSGSGEGVVYVPKGTYHVTLQSGSGEHTVQVAQDPASPKKITIKTGSGDVKVLV
ncbi:DUF4097 family beta strand repeat-containing protein [Acrocarpospora macrocephala]|uniref:Lipoprotein n=1 Tax=Acrocarpospora macrocephala TaxID=150177 RepID=A0A5M3XBR2_9ACTN|nr:DUF4097 family beta strand repeat-containing protein [Acrocarpospora macrocephala]GES15468.1 lipoprotein [Acrocarpospora macrocephala]